MSRTHADRLYELTAEANKEIATALDISERTVTKAVADIINDADVVT